jgi:hypothetical protein
MRLVGEMGLVHETLTRGLNRALSHPMTGRDQSIQNEVFCFEFPHYSGQSNSHEAETTRLSSIAAVELRSADRIRFQK